MKKLFLLTLICMLSLTFVACEKKEEVEVISAEDIEQNEDFQKVLLETSMMKSEPMTMEERVDYMLAIYRNFFEHKNIAVIDDAVIKGFCGGFVNEAFQFKVKNKIKNELVGLLMMPLINEKWEAYNEELEIDFDTLIPELREKALEKIQ